VLFIFFLLCLLSWHEVNTVELEIEVFVRASHLLYVSCCQGLIV
jgi:hypothetical protein